MSETSTVTFSTPTSPTSLPSQTPAPEQKNESSPPRIEQSDKSPSGSALSPKFAALARKEREILRARESMRAKEYQIAQKEKEYREFQRIKENAKLNPIEGIKALGLSYEDITKYYLNGEKPTADAQIQSVQEQVQKYIQSQEQKEKIRLQREAQATEQQYAQVIDSFKGQISQFVDQNKDTYELTHLYEGQELVYDTIAQHFERTQKIMSTQEAASLVEEYLESEYERAMSAKKFMNKYKRIDTPPKNEEVKGGFQPSKTLNNQMASSAAPSMLSAKNEHDRIQRALAALNK